MKKSRLDEYLASGEHSASIEIAKKKILAGWVKVNGETVRDPSRKITGDETITIERPGGSFVSRGGDKLLHAIKEFNIDLAGHIALDLGASTGGFTDCMLKSGAVKVYAVDVGYNQIDYSLRIDPRVVVMEKTHVKDINMGMFPDPPDFFTADLSFISILKALPSIFNTFEKIDGVVLVKPQFEALSPQLDKGIVRDSDDHREILIRVISGITDIGFSIDGITFSPFKGAAGNIEFLFLVRKNSTNTGVTSGKFFWSEKISQIIETAHNIL